MSKDIIVEDYVNFKTTDGIEHYFVKYINPTFLLCWTKTNYEDYNCNGINVRDIDVDTLKTLRVWDNLPETMQEEIKVGEASKKNGAQEKMAHARSGRRQKYPNIPKEITCISCKNVIQIPPSITAKKLEKMDSTIEKYVEVYECTKCCPPKRGRQKNPANIPTEMVCSCGKKVTYPLSHIKRVAETKGKSVEEFIKEYECKSCNPPLKGRKKDPKNAPQDLICSCGSKVTYPLNNIRKVAGKKGKTVEEFINGYRCQKCNPTKGRQKKK